MNLRTAVAWNFLTVSLAAVVAYFVARTSDEPEPHPHHHHSDSGDFHQWLHENLKLTKEQNRLLLPIEERFMLASREQQKEIIEAGRELASAIRNYSPADPAQVEQAMVRLNRAQVELQKTTLTHFFEMKQHLTPEQGEKLLKWTHDSIIHGEHH